MFAQMNRCSRCAAAHIGRIAHPTASRSARQGWPQAAATRPRSDRPVRRYM